MSLFKSKEEGTVTVTQMPDKSLATLRKLSDDDLHKFISGWDVNTPDHIAGMRELNRRVDRPAEIKSRFAVTIAALAMLISLVSIMKC